MINILMATSAALAPVSVFGIEVDRPLSLSECGPNESYLRHIASQREKKPSRRLTKPYLVYETPTDVPCFQRYTNQFSSEPLATETITIRYPNKERMPIDLVSKPEIQAFIVSGSVELITFVTPSFRYQNLTLSVLKEKFGTPEFLEDVPLQNGFGTKFSALRAVWQPNPNIKATYSSFAVEGTGDFTIGTKKGISAYEAKYASPEPTLKL